MYYRRILLTVIILFVVATMIWQLLNYVRLDPPKDTKDIVYRSFGFATGGLLLLIALVLVFRRSKSPSKG